MPQVRCFVAIEMPEPIRQGIAGLQAQLKPFGERISWVRPQNIHLTLKFLGDVDVLQLPDLIQALATAVEGRGGFDCDVAGLGMLPNQKCPRVLWAGIADAEGASGRLAKNVGDALIKFGFSGENRKFTPHLTIGRIKAPLSREFIQEYKRMQFAAGRGRAGEIVLMLSKLSPDGAVYTPMKRIGLT